MLKMQLGDSMERAVVVLESVLRCPMDVLDEVVDVEVHQDFPGQCHCCVLLFPTEPHPLLATHLILHRHTQQLQLHPPTVVAALSFLTRCNSPAAYTELFKRDHHMKRITQLFQTNMQLTSTTTTH